jgi:hypothetical protein
LIESTIELDNVGVDACVGNNEANTHAIQKARIVSELDMKKQPVKNRKKTHQPSAVFNNESTAAGPDGIQGMGYKSMARYCRLPIP